MTRAVADARMTYQYNFLDNLATKTKSNAKGDVAPRDDYRGNRGSRIEHVCDHAQRQVPPAHPVGR